MKHPSLSRLLPVLTVLSLLTGFQFAQAAAPRLVNYQGRLTDAGGVALPDGPKNLRFIIWNSPTLSAPVNEVWNSGPTTVTTSGGLFSIALGASPQPALDPVDFADTNLWLGITVGADPEISPRTRITASPYLLTGDQFVSAAGDTMTGPLATPDLTIGSASADGELKVRQFGTGNLMGLVQQSFNNGGELLLYDEAQNVTHYLLPTTDNGGVITIFGANGSNTGTELTGGGYGGASEPTFSMQGSSNNLNFNMGSTGDNTITLPGDAINALEIQNEPGIASNHTSLTTILTRTQTSSIDILSVTITTPSDGYIVIDGYSTFFLLGEGTCLGWVQISETAGAAGGVSLQYVNAQSYGNVGGSPYTYETVPVKRIFFKSAGTYTFYLQGNAYSGNGASTVVYFQQSQWLTATYFPTSYGSVVTPVPATEELDGKNAHRVPANPDGTGERTIYTADLRQLELKAAESARKAAEDQLAVERARFAKRAAESEKAPE